MNPEKELQLEKLARTLLKGNVARTYKEALEIARSIMKIPEPVVEEKQEEVDPSSLPKVEEIPPAPVSLGIDFDRNKTLKEVIDEDAKKIYGKQPSPSQ